MEAKARSTLAEGTALAEWAARSGGLARAPDGEALVRKAAELATPGVDLERRTVSAVISTGSIDRQGDTVDPLGWQLERYQANPVVLWAHDYKALPIAKALDVSVKGSGKRARLRATARFETFPFADAVFNLIASGSINATSVGFVPLEWKFAEEDEDRGFAAMDITKAELLEYSIVPVPANAEALIGAKGLTQDSRNALYRWVAEAVEDEHPTSLTKSDLDTLHRAWGTHALHTLTGMESLDLAKQNLKRMTAKPSAEDLERPTIDIAGIATKLEPVTKPRVGRDGPGRGNSGVQTLVFDKDLWSVAGAQSWASEHDFYSSPVDESEGSIRIRQFDPDKCSSDSFSTLRDDLPDGVALVTCTGKSVSAKAAARVKRLRLFGLRRSANALH